MSDAFFDPNAYMGQVGGYDIGSQPSTPLPNVSTPSVDIPVGTPQQFTSQVSTDTGTYTPTFDFGITSPAQVPQVNQAFQGYSFAPSVTTTDPLASALANSGLSSPISKAYGQSADLAPVQAQYALGLGQPNIGGVPFPIPRPTDAGTTPVTAPYDTGAAAPETGGATTASGGGISDFLKSLGLSGDNLTKLLMGGAGGLISYLGAQKAQQQAADAAATYQQAGQTAAQQYQQLAQPTLTAGGTNLAMAQQGALSPAELQGFQAAQAQIAQGAAGGGGAAGAAQGAAALQRAYQAAVADQIKNATALLAIGDPIAQAAIQAELQGTQGGLDLELKYGSAASTALGQLMANLAGGIGKTA